jgi:lipopolysaccharide/colanic/teichoic acid biosynthesis glycosyltransferase
MRHNRYIPLIRNVWARTAIGFILLVLTVIVAGMFFSKGRLEVIISITTVAWLLSVFITDKYIHKYPQRYFTYLMASHLKAALSMAIFLWIFSCMFGNIDAPQNVMWTGYIIFVFVDVFVSVPRQREITDQFSKVGQHLSTGSNNADRSSNLGYTNKVISSIDKQTIIRQISSDLDIPLIDFIEENLPDIQGSTSVLVLDDVESADDQYISDPVKLLIGRTRMNDVHRLNQFMQFCAKRIQMEGYFIIRYMPYENVIERLKDRYPGHFYWLLFILYFMWYRAIPKIQWLDRLYFSPVFSWLDTIHLSLVKKRNRALSKAEVWGRLSFWGMKVLAESKGSGELYIIAQRVSLPVQNKIPSYYLIASLEKVGLDGQIISSHKIRTMYPFSEFIQQRIFEDHGLAPTGKFANDFRLTDYGRFLRKYWLDELPQIFDWLRGGIKLVGMRATSQHFLSLYPKEFYDLYIQIKPGLIPPIFDENTNGFDQIVDVELRYLKSYWEQPIRTDIRYFCKTFMDIVFRGVRSK